MPQSSNTAAVAGPTRRNVMPVNVFCARAARKIWALRLREGARGVQVRKRASNSFISFSFIRLSLQAGPQFLQAITVPPCGGIGRNLEQLADLLESVIVPDFQHDHLALFLRQHRQAAPGLVLLGVLVGCRVKPRAGLEFTGQAPPKRPPMVQRPVAEGSHAVMFRLPR